jgi:hypothetical protein
LTAQEANAAHPFIERAPMEEHNAFDIPMRRSPTFAELRNLTDLAGKWAAIVSLALLIAAMGSRCRVWAISSDQRAILQQALNAAKPLGPGPLRSKKAQRL